MKSTTRLSTRKKKIPLTSTRNSVSSPGMADSAYEADDSARSDTSPPKQRHQPMDEYSDKVDDMPLASKTRKRKNPSQSKPNNKLKKSHKARPNLNISASTPVFEGTKSRDNSGGRLVTPEVTPILAVDHYDQKQNTANVQNENLSTPTLRRSLRKRSFSFHDPELSAISTELSFDSQADSGIVVSPPLKKVKSSCTVSSKSLKEYSVPSEKSHDSKNMSVPHKEGCYSVRGKLVLKESALNSSCFGFDSIQTPSPVNRPKKSRIPHAKKTAKMSKKEYRSPVDNSSDSVYDHSPQHLHSDSSSVNVLGSHRSTSLFSDDMFSDDGDQMVVNKSSVKSYKGSRPKITKIAKSQVSKLDAWASSFNTELESIEKFDLNIE